MKILVTGGRVHRWYSGGLLAAKGHTAVVYDNLSHGRRDLLAAGWNLWKGSWQTGLRLKTFSLPRSQGQPFDGVLHFAALIEAGESMVRRRFFQEQHRLDAHAA